MARKLATCPCCKNTISVKTFSLFTFLILLCIGVFPGIIYLLSRTVGRKKCQICKSKF